MDRNVLVGDKYKRSACDNVTTVITYWCSLTRTCNGGHIYVQCTRMCPRDMCLQKMATHGIRSYSKRDNCASCCQLTRVHRAHRAQSHICRCLLIASCLCSSFPYVSTPSDYQNVALPDFDSFASSYFLYPLGSLLCHHLHHHQVYT